MAGYNPVTTSNDIPSGLQESFVREFLYETKAYLPHYKFAKKEEYPKGSKGSIRHRRMLPLASDPVPSQEGITGPGTKPRKADITTPVEWFNNFILSSDVYEFESTNNILTTHKKLLAAQMGKVMDKLMRNRLASGTNVYRAGDGIGGTVSTRAEVKGIVNEALMNKIRRTARDARLRAYKAGSAGSEKSNTFPTAKAIPVFCGSDVLHTIETFTGFKFPHEYNNAVLCEEEYGQWKNLKFIECDFPMVYEGEGAATGVDVQETSSSADVHCLFVVGEDSYGAVKIGGDKTSTEFIVHNAGSSGSADPANQRSSVAWKTPQGTIILDDQHVIRVEVAVAA